MTPLEILGTGLQLMSSWLMSITTALGIFVSILLGLAVVELVLGRGGLSRAYTVKNASCEEHGVSAASVRIH